MSILTPTPPRFILLAYQDESRPGQVTGERPKQSSFRHCINLTEEELVHQWARAILHNTHSRHNGYHIAIYMQDAHRLYSMCE